MGVGRLDIGQGIGGATIFGHNPAIQQFGEMLAQRKAKQEQDNKFLNEQLATNYDPGALRNDADKSTYLKKYQDIKQQAIDAENEKDETKRALKIAEVRQQLGNLSAWGEGSKKQAAIDKQLAMEFMKNPDHYEDDSINKYKSGLQKQWDDKDVINNPSQVERRVDPNKLQTEYEKLKTDQIKPTQWTNGTKKVYTFDGKRKEVIEQNRGVPIDGDNGAYEIFLHKVTSDPNWKKGLKDMYPEINTGNPTQDLALRARKYMHDQGDVTGWYDKPKEISMEGREPVRPSWLEGYYMKNFGVPFNPNTASNQPNYVQGIADKSRSRILSGFGGTPQAISNPFPELENLFSANPDYKKGLSPTVNQDGTLTVTVPAKYKYDPKKVQHDDDGKVIPNSGRVKSKDAYKVTFDPNNEEQFRSVFGQLYDEATGEKSGEPSKIMKKVPTKTKTANINQIRNLVGKPGYEGYTEQELIDYYKKQGYTIK